MSKIGVIGLGNMGGRIARHLIEKGHQLCVYDADSKILSDFEDSGARTASSLKHVAENCRLVLTVLPNADIVKKVVLGEDGLVSGFQSGSILVDMTSSVPDVTKQIGEILSRNRMKMLDAPVSGGLKKAEEGTLTVMVGGDEETYTEVLPIFKDIGSLVTHVGDLGAGHTIKALNNLVSATTFAITAEALAIGVKSGLKPGKMLEVINNSTGKNNSSENKFPQHVLTRDFNVGFAMDLMYKDLKIATDIARKTKSPAFTSSTVFELWQQAQQKGDRNTDHSEFAKLIEEMSGVEIKD